MKQRNSRSRPSEYEAGFTLIEMMVSLAVLSVVLAATAASLITFTRASVDNERRLQATAYLNNLHEELQAVPWAEAELYEEEAAAGLAAVGADFSTTPPTFEGEAIATREGPGCLPLPDCRVEVIPFAYEADVVNADGRTYEVHRIITDVSRGGSAERDVKRFTTIVRWESLGETVEQRFDSERAPTPEEYAAANVPEVTQFLITPAENQLDESGEAMQSMSVVARFRDEVVGASLHLPDGTSITLTRDGTSNRFTGSVPAGGHVFADGEQPFEVRGDYAAGGYASDTTMVNFLEYHEGVVLPSPAPVVHSVTVDQYSYTVARYSGGSQAFQLCSPLTVRVRVSGLEPGIDGAPTNGSVTAYYEAGSPQGAGLVGPATIDGTDDEFLLVFPVGTKSPWEPAARSGSTPPATVVDAFTVAANNDGGPQSDLVTSSEVQFTGSDKSNGKC